MSAKPHLNNSLPPTVAPCMPWPCPQHCQVHSATDSQHWSLMLCCYQDPLAHSSWLDVSPTQVSNSCISHAPWQHTQPPCALKSQARLLHTASHDKHSLSDTHGQYYFKYSCSTPNNKQRVILTDVRTKPFDCDSEETHPVPTVRQDMSSVLVSSSDNLYLLNQEWNHHSQVYLGVWKRCRV